MSVVGYRLRRFKPSVARTPSECPQHSQILRVGTLKEFWRRST